ncbi:DUF378 domain-containing protein [Clostridium luticellarii]|jgi:uncharacterized membrane protein YuzA (DUF378 family)|uniref:DUF378 domain-containing protein n=1 Tax=Clostridium luticellarii TaxID=1691940 RepID=UPI002354305A|nr:DUF378 domain-containing protein [Clostridium luticellarii]MCI1943942.1 DUF378 domain-containing protein [Clostridium luticellarii]MCI1967203.1 DUF378 domain-containing protein [Clostridium luticellarii]MCI1995934.1 DUF378 domain-containing protein [Clostridium luticellarii]MCI2038477.1 DUF378 domain-containing protein [Clostridium luticellarii]
MYKFSIIDKTSLILIIIGAINWGLIGLFNFNMVGIIFGEPANLVGRIIYILIGVAGIDMIMLLFKTKNSCK